MSEPVVDEEDVRHVAELARIDLTGVDIDRFQSEFAEILDYFDRLDEVPTVEVEDDRVNIMRPDEVQPSLSQEQAMANTDDTEDGRFKGPRVS